MTDPNEFDKVIPEENLRRLHFTVCTTRGDFKVNATEATLAKYVADGIGSEEFAGFGETYHLCQKTGAGYETIGADTLLWDVIKDGDVIYLSVMGQQV